MAFDNFSSLLEGVLNGNEQALQQWDNTQYFSMEEIEKMLVDIKTNLATMSKRKNGHALNLRAKICERGLGRPVNYEQAAQIFDEAILLGSVSAINSRALLYLKGRGADVNYVEAIRLSEQAIALGCAAAMNLRAYIYELGVDGPAAYDKAIDLCEQAIELGDVSAMYGRARQYERGLGGDIDYPNAILLYKEAAQLNHAPSVRALSVVEAKFQASKKRAPCLQEVGNCLSIRLGNGRSLNHRDKTPVGLSMRLFPHKPELQEPEVPKGPGSMMISSV